MTQTIVSNGALIDGRGGQPLPGASILIEGERTRLHSEPVETQNLASWVRQKILRL